MNDEIAGLLKVHNYFRGVSDAALADVLGKARVMTVAAGEVVHEPQDSISDIGFVLRGRLKSVRVDAQGRESLFRIFDRGDQFGMMLGALQEPVPVRVFALEPTTVLIVDHAKALELSLQYPELRRLWLQTYAGSLRRHLFGASVEKGPAVLGLIHETPASRHWAVKVMQRLASIGESIAIFSDVEDWRAHGDFRFRPLVENGQPVSDEIVRRQVAEWNDSTRIVFDLSAHSSREETEKLFRLVDRVVYFVPAGNGAEAAARLQSLDVAGRGWSKKLSIAWSLPDGQNLGPIVPGLRDLVSRDFKLSDSPLRSPWGRSLVAGFERLIHDLRGIHIGIALGGGAARGMAHLGVLKILEQNGIVADMIAGTSAGAMTGVLYASGLDCDYCARQFSADLTPSWLFRHLPRGDQLYLLYKYRCGQFDPMLRRYLQQWKLEQLPVPSFPVTVDLVGGKPVVRDSGDAVHSILESINLPVLSVPIIREGRALIDGGLINNIPADVLVSSGCNFVIAVSVTAKMEARFCNITPDKPTPRRAKPGMVSTLLRSLLVQSHNLNAIGVQPADIVIEPDVTGFELTEFMRATELAAIGERAALDQIPKIRQLLHRLDARLFPLAADPTKASQPNL